MDSISIKSYHLKNKWNKEIVLKNHKINVFLKIFIFTFAYNFPLRFLKMKMKYIFKAGPLLGGGVENEIGKVLS